jgi:hypothetical protein
VPVGAAVGVPAGTPAASEGLSAPAGEPAPAIPTPAALDQPEPAATSLADALTGIAADYLAGKIATAANPDIYQVVVHVGPEALTTDPLQPANLGQSADPSRAADGHHPVADVPAGTSAAPVVVLCCGHAAAVVPNDDLERSVKHPAHPRRCHLEDGPAISLATAQRLACAATFTWMLHDHDGSLLDFGRRHRRPSPALRRAVRERDKYRCQFPGCHSRRTDIHHIRHWSRGGKTRLRNLISLCEAHHVIVHELGYLITETDNGTYAFTRPDATPMPNSPALPEPDGDITSINDAVITAATVDTSPYGDRFDLDLAIWAAFANARVLRERAERAAAR